ncbi:hypothetical protein, partial [Caballeronia calidae]|uniref:hypothetical protein n=1 Tax=Caballeronia calidae TaxID=1777139 RepID=UPI0012FD7B0B
VKLAAVDQQRSDLRINSQLSVEAERRNLQTLFTFVRTVLFDHNNTLLASVLRFNLNPPAMVTPGAKSMARAR